MKSFNRQKYVFVALLSFGFVFASGCEDEEAAEFLANINSAAAAAEETAEPVVAPDEDPAANEEAEDGEAEDGEETEDLEEGEEPTMAAAATRYPEFPDMVGLSSYSAGYCRSTADDTPVYTTSSLTTRLGTIYASDEVYVYNINTYVSKPYAELTYPVGSSRKRGYIHLDKLTAANYSETISPAKAAVTVYRRPGGAVYGSIAQWDNVMTVALVSGYYQVFYNARAGSRGWKIGYVTQADYNKIKGSINPFPPGYCPYSEPTVTLQRGSKGTGVQWVQCKLNYHGASPQLIADGDFGLNTHNAVVAFQKKKGLSPVDGIVGPVTRAYLR